MRGPRVNGSKRIAIGTRIERSYGTSLYVQRCSPVAVPLSLTTTIIVSWSSGYLGYFWNAYNSIDEVFHTDLWHEHAQHSIDDLVGDIQAGTLPPVTWAVPYFQLSDHPPASWAFTHNWVMDVVDALMRSDLWEHTVLFLTWDEWGGSTTTYRLRSSTRRASASGCRC
jgi:hypothetical protein